MVQLGNFPLILAPTGMVPTKTMNVNVPLTPMEIARDVSQCSKLGLSSVHIHARDELGLPTWEKSIYAQIVTEIKLRCPEIIINVSTSGRNWSDLEKRADALALDGDLKPDVASLTTSSLNFISGPSVNSPEVVRGLAKIMLERGITPELELFDLGMVNAAKVLHKEGLLPKVYQANLFLGSVYGAQARQSHLDAMLEDVSSDTIWSGAGIGRFQETAVQIALRSGGGARVGLEDALHMDAAKTIPATNFALVERAVVFAQSLGLTPMTPVELRSRISAPSAAA